MINQVRYSMTLFLPWALGQLGEMSGSIHRLQDFLMMDEKEKGEVTDEERLKTGALVTLKEVKAKWRKQELDNTLDGVSIEVNRAQLLAVIGPVGSGKTSLLQVNPSCPKQSPGDPWGTACNPWGEGSARPPLLLPSRGGTKMVTDSFRPGSLVAR